MLAVGLLVAVSVAVLDGVQVLNNVVDAQTWRLALAESSMRALQVALVAPVSQLVAVGTFVIEDVAWQARAYRLGWRRTLGLAVVIFVGGAVWAPAPAAAAVDGSTACADLDLRRTSFVAMKTVADLTRHFAPGVELPPDLSAEVMAAAILRLRSEWAAIDQATREIAGTDLANFVSGDEQAAVSQLVSRRIVHAIEQSGAYERDRAQRFPDLWHRASRTPLEVKANLYPNPAQGHNAKTGWYLAVRYVMDAERLPLVMEVRIGHVEADRIRVDGKRPGSGRTETVSLRWRDLATWYRLPKAELARMQAPRPALRLVA